MKEQDFKGEIIGTNFIFNKSIEVRINRTQSLKFKPIMPDSAVEHFKIGIICLNNKKLPDNESLIFMENSSGEDQIVKEHHFICCFYPGYDNFYTIDTNKNEGKYDELIFFICRPKSDNKNSWIDHETVKSFSNEVCYISFEIGSRDDSTQINNIPFEYNKFGATVLFKLFRDNDDWKLNLNRNNFQNGLIDIMEKYGYKMP